MNIQIQATAMQAEFLDQATEASLVYAWQEHGDRSSRDRLLNAYRRLAIAIVKKYNRYGIPTDDLTQEAEIGLLKAADKFDPSRGFRFSTYAIWWIRASVQEYILRNWSLVRIGSTVGQKKLFFSLRKLKAKLQQEAESKGESWNEHRVHLEIATQLNLRPKEVTMMAGVLAGADCSFNVPRSADSEGNDWIDSLEDERALSGRTVEQALDQATLKKWLSEALEKLSKRERDIVEARRLRDDVLTLGVLSEEFGVTRERIRQIEEAALTKIRMWFSEHHPEARYLFFD